MKVKTEVSQKDRKGDAYFLRILHVIYRILECLVALHAELQEEIAHKVNGGPPPSRKKQIWRKNHAVRMGKNLDSFSELPYCLPSYLKVQ